MNRSIIILNSLSRADYQCYLNKKYISYYCQDINQFVVLNDLNGIDENTNAGKVNIQGVETVIEYQPFDFIRFGITHTFASNI